MMIQMNRFLTRGEVGRLYRIPPGVLPDVMGAVEPAYQEGDGEPYYIESEVDHAVADFARSAGGRPPACIPAPEGKRGRKVSTEDIAKVVNEMRARGESWKEITAACKRQFAGRVTGVEQVRTIWRRHFGGKK